MLLRHRQRVAGAFGLDQGDVGVQARVLAGAAPLGDRLRGAVEQLDRTLFEPHPPLRGKHRVESQGRFGACLAPRILDLSAQGLQRCGRGLAAARLLAPDLDRLRDAQAPLAGVAIGSCGAASRALDAEFGVVEKQ